MIVAQVYPLLRLPRRFAWFDYELRDGQVFATGDLIRMPFKGREVLGIVKQVAETDTDKALLKINSLALASYLSPADLSRYETIAQSLLQSVSSLLFTIIPSTFPEGTPTPFKATQAPTISVDDLPKLEQLLTLIEAQPKLAVSGDTDLGFALAHSLRRRRQGQMLILLPRERDVELVGKYLNLGSDACLLHGHTAERDRAQIIEAWRQGEIKTLVGSRLVSLLPAKQLTTVLVLEAGNDEFLNLRRNPRFDAREAVKLLAEQHHAKLIFFDPLPRLEELVDIPFQVVTHALDAKKLISLKSAEESGQHEYISESLAVGIETALHSQKKVLLYFNRKGVAKRLQCSACGYIPTCGTCGHIPFVRDQDLVCPNCRTEMWLPTDCPSCHKPKLALKGIGGSQLVKTLQKLFPDASVGKIEKGDLSGLEAQIQVVTEFFFTSITKPFAPKVYGLVADVLVDLPLNAPDFRGNEVTARKLQRLVAFGERQGADVLIQTWLPEIIQPMLELSKFVDTELKARKTYELPPTVSRLVLLDVAADELPEGLKSRAQARDHELDIINPTLDDLEASKQLSDKIKLIFDGPYGNSQTSTNRT